MRSQFVHDRQVPKVVDDKQADNSRRWRFGQKNPLSKQGILTIRVTVLRLPDPYLALAFTLALNAAPAENFGVTVAAI